MRSIKFRAWDDKNDKWLLGYEYEGLGGFSLTGETVLMGEWGNVFWSFISDEDKDFEDLKVMQYTGLKDKNGQEIYEGDIVSAENRYYIVEYREQYCDYVFTYTKKNWKRVKVSKQNITRLDIEVIGNKFENPELIDK